ncbi:MAG: thioester domain-containing protein, partial [Anaerotignum sp.]|nr:thioester domain-containing protein [Anaerotignum sp.]
MTKEKQTRRMIAMALAACVATSAMPVTAFATEGEGGAVNPGSSTTEVTEKKEGNTTTVTEKTTDADGNVTEYKTTETTTTEDEKKNITVNVEIKESTGAAAEQAAADAENNGAESEDPEGGEGTEPSPEPTPEEAGQEFGENFESSEIETSSSTSTSGEETTNTTQVTDSKDRPVSSSSSTEGWQETTDVESSHEKYEQEVSSTANPDGTKTWKEVGDKYFVTGEDGVENEVSKEEYDAAAEESRRMEAGTSVKYYVKDENGEYQEVTKEQYDDANYGFITESENEDTESDITVDEVPFPDGELSVDLKPGEEKTDGIAYDTVVNAMQTALTNQIVDGMKAEYGEDAVSYDGETGTCTVTVPAAEGDTHTTTIEMVLRPIMTDGKITGFETVKTVIRTPLNGVVTEGPVVEGESSEDVSFGPLEETTTTEKFVKLPEKPDTTEKVDEVTGHKTVYEVTPKYDEDGEQVGWIKTSVIYDKDGKEIGGGSETVMGEITYKSVTKQVDKTTTVTTTGQQTVETEKVIEKEVTTSTVTISAEQREYWAKLWAKMSEVESSGDHGKVDIKNSIVVGNPASHYVQLNADGSVMMKDGKPVTATLETLQTSGTKFAIVDEDGNIGTAQNGKAVMNALDLLYGRQYWTLAEERVGETYSRTEYNKYGVDEGELRFDGYGIWSQFKIQDSANEHHYVRLYEMYLEDGNAEETNEVFYAYCAELGRRLLRGAAYTLENIDNPSHYTSQKEHAKENLEAIVTNGYWAADEGQGSLDAVKALLKANGYEAEAEKMTPGIAMAATQAAIWHYGNEYASSDKGIYSKTVNGEVLYDIISFEYNNNNMKENGAGTSGSDLNGPYNSNRTLTNDQNLTANALFKLLISIYDDEAGEYGDAV